MSRKGIVLLTKSMIESLVIIALILFVIFLFIGRYFQMEVVLEEESYARLGIQLAHALLSYPRLTAEEGGRILKGVFDEEKIKRLHQEKSEREKLYQDISLSHATNVTYKIRIKLITGEEYLIEKELPPLTRLEIKFDEIVPIAVKIGEEKRAGIMEVFLGDIVEEEYYLYP